MENVIAIQGNRKIINCSIKWWLKDLLMFRFA